MIKSLNEYTPDIYNRDSKLTAFVSKIDSIILDIKKDIIGLDDFKKPEKVNTLYLDDLGQYFNAGINQFDTERQKREKLATAVEGHKKRGSFNFDAKAKIDAVAGGDSQLIKTVGVSDWILIGDGTTPSAYDWASLGTDGVDDDLGLDLSGDGLGFTDPGNIFIDVDNASLSSDDQDRIRANMEDTVSAYFFTHFGYVTGGVFTEYFVMG